MGFIKKNVESLKLPKGTDTFQQAYARESGIEGVAVVKLAVFADDQGGWFKENLRLNEDGEVLALKEQNINFKVRQTNTSLIGPHGKRFWHIHPQQDEIWTTNGTLLLGLVDLRKNSKTHNQKMKIVLSPERAVFIPHGIAHGLLNPCSERVTLIYFASHYFEATENSQEYRIDPKSLSFDFVEPEVM